MEDVYKRQVHRDTLFLGQFAGKVVERFGESQANSRHGKSPIWRRNVRGSIAVSYTHLDVYKRQALADEIAAADIVTLDRVVCCYPDMAALVHHAAAKAGRFLGLVYPRDSWWTKAGVAMLNLLPRLRGDAFRSFVHPTAAVEGLSLIHISLLRRAPKTPF